MKPGLSLGLLWVQLVLLVATAFIWPRRLRPRWLDCFPDTVLVSFLWLGYAILAMCADSWLNHDVPGIGYLLTGFPGWLIGSASHFRRILKGRNITPPPA